MQNVWTIGCAWLGCAEAMSKNAAKIIGPHRRSLDGMLFQRIDRVKDEASPRRFAVAEGDP
jgi:hypothetical protein